MVRPNAPASALQTVPTAGSSPVRKKCPIFELAQALFADRELWPTASMVRTREPVNRGDHVKELSMGVAGSIVLLTNNIGFLVFAPKGPENRHLALMGQPVQFT